DGTYENWTIENNLVATDIWQGIGLYGAINCQLINNTVVKNPINFWNFTPWITINPHKNGTPSVGNLIRNNLAFKLLNTGLSATVDHNIVITDPSTFFADYNGFDFNLKSTSPAIDSGNSLVAPLQDIDKVPRMGAHDIGAYEYSFWSPGLLCYEGFKYDSTTNISAAKDSSTDIGWLGNTWSSSSDVTQDGLSHTTVPENGNALTFSSNVSAVRSIDPSVMSNEYSVIGTDGVRRLGKPGTTLWVSFILCANSADTDVLKTCGLDLLGSSLGGNVKLTLGDTGSGNNWSAMSATINASSNVAIVPNQPVFLVAKITFVAGTNNDRVELYVNPDVSSSALVPNAILLGRDIGTFDRVAFKGSRIAATGDEIRIGTSWSAVAGHQ
ncbi:MAG: choice-of-anchor Q domain-containing protein, partial [Verrucomicrobiota bacterium]